MFGLCLLWDDWGNLKGTEKVCRVRVSVMQQELFLSCTRLSWLFLRKMLEPREICEFIQGKVAFFRLLPLLVICHLTVRLNESFFIRLTLQLLSPLQFFPLLPNTLSFRPWTKYFLSFSWYFHTSHSGCLQHLNSYLFKVLRVRCHRLLLLLTCNSTSTLCKFNLN